MVYTVGFFFLNTPVSYKWLRPNYLRVLVKSFCKTSTLRQTKNMYYMMTREDMKRCQIVIIIFVVELLRSFPLPLPTVDTFSA